MTVYRVLLIEQFSQATHHTSIIMYCVLLEKHIMQPYGFTALMVLVSSCVEEILQSGYSIVLNCLCAKSKCVSLNTKDDNWL